MLNCLGGGYYIIILSDKLWTYLVDILLTILQIISILGYSNQVDITIGVTCMSNRAMNVP